MDTAVSPEEELTLAAIAPDVLSKFDAPKRSRLNILYPQPEQRDVERELELLRSDWDAFHACVEVNRDVRYQRDQTPEKWRRHLESDRRVRTRLSHNEILRVASSQTRNPYKVTIAAADDTDPALERAEKQQRWANELMGAFESYADEPLRRQFVDTQNADGLVYWEVYLTGAYDNVDAEYRDITDVVDGTEVTRKETHREFMKRTNAEFIEAGMPIGLRKLDPLSVYYRKDDQGGKVAIVHERKPYSHVYAHLLETKSSEQIVDLQLPKPGTPGWPYRSTGSDDANGDVETIRYYDRRWYVYIVGGKLIEVSEHKMPGLPIFQCAGQVTGSPNLSEKYQGIAWGMLDIELTLNDQLTLANDVAFTYSRPKPVVETDVGASLMLGADKKPRTLDLSDPQKVIQLNPGQRVRDAFEGFQPRLNDQLMTTLFGIWERSGQNPIAQGQSPGADPAGYTVNTLQGAALSLYEIFLDNEARTWSKVVDFVRKVIKYTLKLPMALLVPLRGTKSGTEWLVLGPDDIDDTTSKTTIDPLSDAQRLALRASLITGWEKRLIRRERVQRDGYGVDDPDLEDTEILFEGAKERLAAMVIDNAFQRTMPQPAGPQGSGLVDQNGQPLPSSQPEGPGAMPAPPQAPTVGAQANAASAGPMSGGRGGGGMNASRALAGQGRTTPAQHSGGVMTPTAG